MNSQSNQYISISFHLCAFLSLLLKSNKFHWHSLSHVHTYKHMQCFEYLEEKWTLALSLRAGGPEPMRKSIRLCGGDVVAQSQRLLL